MPSSTKIANRSKAAKAASSKFDIERFAAFVAGPWPTLSAHEKGASVATRTSGRRTDFVSAEDASAFCRAAAAKARGRSVGQ